MVTGVRPRDSRSNESPLIAEGEFSRRIGSSSYRITLHTAAVMEEFVARFVNASLRCTPQWHSNALMTASLHGYVGAPKPALAVLPLVIVAPSDGDFNDGEGVLGAGSWTARQIHRRSSFCKNPCSVHPFV